MKLLKLTAGLGKVYIRSFSISHNLSATNKRLIFAKHFEGEPKMTDFKLVEEKIPDLKNGDVHFEALFISVDPYMRPVSTMKETGGTMFGAQVAKVVNSKHPDFKVGDNVVGYLGWQTNTVANPDKVDSPFGGLDRPRVLPDFKGLPLSLALGILGMPGNTAYFGLTELCQPKKGETVAISGAGGAVGSLVGQMAKNMGCRVVGFDGTDEKVEWLVKEMKFDAAINYKKEDMAKSLKEKAPKGVDCYFDNVGGIMSSVVLSQMNPFGRIAVCGAISAYNADPKNPPQAPIVQTDVVLKQLRMEGFMVQRWLNRWNEGIEQNIEWVSQGKLKFKEFVTEGFENLPKALAGTLRGDGSGKALVKV